MYPSQPQNQSRSPNPGQPAVFIAGSVRDAAGVQASPGAVAVVGDRILAAGEVADVRRIAGGDAPVIDLPDRLLIPGLVNAHTHLDLTGIGCQPYGGNFIEWIKMVIAHRRHHGFDPVAAVRQGLELSRDAGVLTVGDIAGSVEAVDTLVSSTARGVSFLELVGHTRRQAQQANTQRTQWVKQQQKSFGSVRVGLQPHALYSTAMRWFEVAATLHAEYGTPVSTHLAETPQEDEFLTTGKGQLARLLRTLGDAPEPPFALHDGAYDDPWGPSSPVEWLLGVEWTIESPEELWTPWLLAHCNYVDVEFGEAQVNRLLKHGASVAYCPRASEYFGHANHRYRDMLEAGVNVCLGTDSIVCHGSLSILDEMRRLYQRDATEPALLLAMATTRGMRGLRLAEADATFTVGRSPGVVAVRYDPTSDVEALKQVLSGSGRIDIEVLCEAKCSSKETP
jgi:cytosine/adenosine deaminase-related metal-dependent hydrolase